MLTICKKICNFANCIKVQVHYYYQMIVFKRYIFLILAMVVMMMTAVSCRDEEDLPNNDNALDDKALLVLNIGTLGSGQGTRAVSDDEVINTLRLVILNGDEVEWTENVHIENPTKSQTFMVLLKTGPKKVFLVANAEDVPIYVSGEKDETTGEPKVTTVEEFFNRYPIGSTGFKDAINSVYFDNSYFNTDGTVPLTAVYDINVEYKVYKDENGTEKGNFFDLWLVKAATKYSVNFTNKRSSPLFLEELSISSLYRQMYLIPQVNEQTKGGKYWIDWLHEVSDLSHLEGNLTEQGNIEFNKAYGWIKDYSVPGKETFIFTPVKGANLTIPGLQTSAGQEAEPGTAKIGPFYATEGKNLIENNADGDQSYLLALKLIDTKDGQEVTLSRTLPNLSALFRNTHVIINIDFDESYMHVYGEIGAWNSSKVYGSLTEE